MQLIDILAYISSSRKCGRWQQSERDQHINKVYKIMNIRATSCVYLLIEYIRVVLMI